MNREETIQKPREVIAAQTVSYPTISQAEVIFQTAFEKAQTPTDTVPHVALYHADGTPKSNDEVRADAAEIRAKYADTAQTELLACKVDYETNPEACYFDSDSTYGDRFCQAHGTDHEPTDAQVEQALAALSRFNGWNDNPHGAMRAALKAAFTAGQEEQA